MCFDNLKELKESDISSCNPESLVDLRTVEIKRNKSALQRSESFIEQAGNPYLFKVGDTIVRVEFGNGKAFAEMLTDIIVSG